MDRYSELLKSVQTDLPEFNPDQIEMQLGPDADPTCVTFVIRHEDHTLANALRYMIMKNPDVAFCGYTMPHPSEPKVEMRIQTESREFFARDAFAKGLDDLMDLCAAIAGKMEKAREAHDWEDLGSNNDW